MNVKTQNAIAVIAGLSATAAVAIALLPVIKMLFADNVAYSLDKGLVVNYAAVYGYEFLWITVSAFIGGYVACWIAAEKKVLYSLLTGFFSFLILVTATVVVWKTDLTNVLMAFTFIPLTLMGGIVRQIVENKRVDQNQ